ncbi:MAG TPA: CDP-diacylglycerol--serine O-phosphatidyltransferase [Nitrospiria bacterium]|nr:CDP-diacylglycerol--serine O-phosphatidyltransferase [Nitrospiria bacterium]
MSDPSHRRRGIYLLPNLLTTGNLFSGFYGIVSIMSANYVRAAVAVFVAVVFDILDGQIARYTKTSSRFGLEYDSLADLVSFGIAPGLLIYTWALTGYGRLGWVAAFLFVACGALRLARYNVQAGSGDGRYFLGLPIPAAAGLIAATVLLDDHILRLGKELRPIIILLMTYLLAFLMVSRARYRAFKVVQLPQRRLFELLVGAVLTLIMFTLAPQVMLFAVFVVYALSGLVETPLRLLLARKARRPPLMEGGEHRAR